MALLQESHIFFPSLRVCGPLLLFSQQKLNTPAVLKAPKERKPSKKEGGSPGKSSSLPAILYRWIHFKREVTQRTIMIRDEYIFKMPIFSYIMSHVFLQLWDLQEEPGPTPACVV